MGYINFVQSDVDDARKFAWTETFMNAVLDCSWGMERTVQVLAAHCVLKQSSDIVASPGTCPFNRQGTAAAAHPHACFSKGCSSTASRALLQRLWGSKAHIYRLACTYAHTHTRTHTHIHTHAHTYALTHTNARKYLQARTRTYTCTRTNTQTHRHTHTHTHIQTPKHTGTHIRTNAHTHACICMHMLRV